MFRWKTLAVVVQRTVWVTACCGIVGCAPGGSRLATYPLKVQVEDAAGNAMEGVRVVMTSEEHRTSATGETGSDGFAVMTTYGKLGDGVVAGEHLAGVSLPESIDDLTGFQPNRKRPKKASIIPPAMANPDTSGLKYTISSDGPREIKITIPTRKK